MGQQSRVLPQRSWAGAVPTLLTHEALDLLCSPSPHPQALPGPELAPLERFLGCVYMRRQLQRFIQSDECPQLTQLAKTEPGVVHFKVDTLHCRVGLNTQHLQSLHIKITAAPEHKDSWSPEEIQVLEKFFDMRVSAPPFKPNSLCCFGRMLSVQFNVLKDFVQIMKLELVPGLAQQQGLKWAVQWCLRIPPSAPPIVPAGQAAVLICRTKILLFLQITRVNYMDAGAVCAPPSLVLPLVYDTNTNLTQLAEKRDPGPATGLQAANAQLKRFVEMTALHGECSLFPAVRDLLANLVLPSEPPQVVSPAGMGQGQSPAGMMHSPMMGPGQPAGPGYGPGPMGPVPMGMQHPMMGPQ